MPAGRVEALHVAPRPKSAMEPRDSVRALAGVGLEGDRYAGRSHDDHLTLVALEELEIAAQAWGGTIAPGSTRRNVTVSGVSLPRTPGARLRIGEALFEVTESAEPCQRMESSVGAGARKALEGRSGVRGRLIEGGLIRVGDAVSDHPAESGT